MKFLFLIVFISIKSYSQNENIDKRALDFKCKEQIIKSLESNFYNLGYYGKIIKIENVARLNKSFFVDYTNNNDVLIQIDKTSEKNLSKKNIKYLDKKSLRLSTKIYKDLSFLNDEYDLKCFDNFYVEINYIDTQKNQFYKYEYSLDSSTLKSFLIKKIKKKEVYNILKKQLN